MTDLASATPSEPDRGDERKRLGIWETLGWAVLVFALTQAAGIAALAVWNVAHDAPPFSIKGYDGAQIALTTLVINALQVALLAGVPRWRLGANPIDYLALTRFSPRNFLIGVVAIVALVATSTALLKPSTDLQTQSSGCIPSMLLCTGSKRMHCQSF